MARPSACGYPDSTNTGIPGGTFLSPMNGVNVTSAGTISNLAVNGCVTISASNVVLSKVRVAGCSASFAIRIGAGLTGVRISDVEVVTQEDQKGIALPASTGEFQVARAYVHGLGDCFGNTQSTEIRDSFCTIGPSGSDADRRPTYGVQPNWCDAGHRDGAELGATQHTIFHHNTVRNPCGQTSALQMDAWNGAMSNVTVTNNLLAGGAWTIYVEPRATNVIVTGNRFARWYWPYSGSAATGSQACIVNSRSGMLATSTWDDSGLPVQA